MPEQLTAHQRDRARFALAAERAGKLEYADPQVRREMQTFAAAYPLITARVAPRSRERHAGRPRSTRAGPSDDPDLERACEVCGGSLAGKRRQAKTCGDRCRQALHRERAALLTRYDVALSIVPKLSRFDERLDLLAAVIWPTDVRLSAPRLREAA